MIKAVIFDLDGTILNTISDLCSSCNYALNFCGMPSITEEETKSFIGNGIKKLCERALKGNISLLDNVYKEMLKHYYDNYNVKTSKYDNIDEIVSFLKKKGLIVGVLSNKKEEVLKKLVKEQFGDAFDIIIGDTGIRKPDPYNINRICTIYGIMPTELLYVGDSNVDVDTVKNASCNGAYVSYGYRSFEELKNYGANPILKTPLELLNYLEDCLQ